MKNIHFRALYALTLIYLLYPLISFARAGGGGSSGGGGGSHSSGGSSFHSSSGSGGVTSSISDFIFSIISIVFICFFCFMIIYTFLKISLKIKAKAIEKVKSEIKIAQKTDAIWNEERLKEVAIDIFYRFQKSWGEIDTKTMSEILEPEMYKKIALELSVLNNEKRRNPTIITKLVDSSIINAHDDLDNNNDSFSVSFSALADDKLIEVDTQKVLFSDRSLFTEIWDFIRTGNTWKLKEIHQETENLYSLIPAISEFAKKNNFFYNPDFGWLMLPNKGILFSDSRFGTTDINNHVIGYFREKIVEFYTMDLKGEGRTVGNYLIAQAILPINYNDIVIRKKKLFQFDPRGLREHSLESNDFNKEYEVFSDEMDSVSTFELLTPNFMEKIMNLPFELTIEVVGNTLYLSTKNTSVDYNQMLEILSYAFDEMKM